VEPSGYAGKFRCFFGEKNLKTGLLRRINFKKGCNELVASSFCVIFAG
jgi:hypothetical protein